MKFFVDKQVFRILPDYCVGTIVISDFDNTHSLPEIDQTFDDAVISFFHKMQGINLKEDARIEPYRTAFRLLNSNPNKYMCSIEALARRVQKKPELPHINPLVDIGNAVSLHHFVPIGVHDISQFDGEAMGVRFCEQGDYFFPMGSERQEYPDKGELLYVSGHSVKTRRWIWRQSDDSKITENTRDVLIVVDGFQERNDKNVQDAMEEIAQMIQKICQIKPIVGMVDKSHSVFEW